MACDMVSLLVQVGKTFNIVLLLLYVNERDLSHYVQVEFVSVDVGA